MNFKMTDKTNWPGNDLNSAGSTITADLTPMLDAIFLIILLLLATLMNSSVVRGFAVNLPAFAEQSAIQKQDGRLEISIDREGGIYIDKEPVRFADLPQTLPQLARQLSATTVLLRADTSVPYGSVAKVLSRMSNCLPDQQVVLVTQLPADQDSQGQPEQE